MCREEEKKKRKPRNRWDFSTTCMCVRTCPEADLSQTHMDLNVSGLHRPPVPSIPLRITSGQKTWLSHTYSGTVKKNPTSLASLARFSWDQPPSHLTQKERVASVLQVISETGNGLRRTRGTFPSPGQALQLVWGPPQS